MIISLLILVISSCSTPNEVKEHANKRKPYEIERDSLFLESVNNHKDVLIINEFEYRYLFELQDMLSANPIIGEKHFNYYQLVRKDSVIYCSYTIDKFNNPVFLELEISDEILEKLNIKWSQDTTYHCSVIYRIDSLNALPFEVYSEFWDSNSKVGLAANASLVGKGKILECNKVFEQHQKNKSD